MIVRKTILIAFILLITGCQQPEKTQPEISVAETVETKNEVQTNKLPKEVQIQFKQGNYFLTKSDYVNAIRKFQFVINRKPKFAQAHYNLGVAYFETKRPEEAIKEWQLTLQYDSDYTKAYLSLGYAYEQLANNTQAVEYYDKYLQLNPDDPNSKVIIEKINTLRGQNVGQGIIGRVVISDDVNPETYQTDHPKDIFTNTKDIIYATAEIGDAPKNTNIKAAWYYLGIKGEEVLVNSKEKILTGPQNMIFAIRKPSKGPWPTGRYEIRLYVNGKENLSVPFTILKEEKKLDAKRKDT